MKNVLQVKLFSVFCYNNDDGDDGDDDDDDDVLSA